MDEARAKRLLARHGPKGYDPARGTFRPWWWFVEYGVEVRAGRGISHVWGRSIVVAFGPDACPHVVVHSLFHETGHVQMLPLDLCVLGASIPLAIAGPWYWIVGVLVGWKFLWKEFTADLYAAMRLGPRNVWLGYVHEWRGARQGRGISKGRDVSQ